ncbi:MAG: PaaI family thioesterase [Hyphomicrobiaceae bacterium]
MSSAPAFPPGTGVAPMSEVARISGLAFMQGIRDGRFPQAPLTALLGFGLTEVENGSAVFAGLPSAAYYNPIGTVHGGWSGVLLDSCMGCAVHSTVSAGEGFTTLEYKVNCVRAITEQTGPVRAEGTVTSRGRRIATAEGRLVDGAGKVLALGSTTCLIFPIGA